MPTDSFINQLMEERDTKVQVIEQLATTASEEGRDLHTTDLETIDNYRSRIKQIDMQIEKVAGDLELADSVRGKIRNLDPNVVARDFSYRSAGEYMWDYIHKGDNSDAGARWQKYHRRAAEHMGLDKANTVPVAGGFNGLVVSPVVGAVLDPAPSGRPLFTALGVRQIDSATFMRPRIVDPNFATGVGPQAGGKEKAELPSKAWDILSEPVSAKVIGGYINVSLLVDWLPSGLDMIVSHMNKRLEVYSEQAAVSAMDNSTAAINLAADADSAAVAAAFGEASTLVFRNTGRLPTWVAMGPEAWGRLIGLTDLAGRPMIPAVGPTNAFGGGGSPDTFFSTFMGMRVVVSYAIYDAAMYIGNEFGLEVYERKLPVLRVNEPSVFGTQISVQTALAFYSPTTKEAGPSNTPPAERNGVVRIDWAA
jgi:hypothetical protein